MPKQRDREAKKVISLSRLERITLEGLQSKEREIHREHIAPLQEDYAELIKEIERNHGVKLGEDYQLNLATAELIPFEKPVVKPDLELVKAAAAEKE